MASGIGYRTWQFWQSLKGVPDPEELEGAAGWLTPEERGLFLQLPAQDQNHSLRVFQTLRGQGQKDPLLLKAALLHDLGKTRHPLRRWERIAAVVIPGIFPGLAKRWGSGEPRGLTRCLVVLREHAFWGAELAQSIGSEERVVWLIRHHENSTPPDNLPDGALEQLQALQAADDQN